MSYQINSLSQNKKELKTEKMKVPTILHGSDELLPNEETLAKLEDIASDERLFHHVASMSDVHSKKGRKTPTGSVIATRNDFLPQVNDTAPNCGMRLIKTDLNQENASPEQLEKLFQELVEVIPTKKYIGTAIPFRLALDVCKQGIAPLRKHLDSRTENEISNAFAEGNFFRDEKVSDQDILNAVPRLFFHIGKYRLGILGAAGNHFLDLMKITDIKNSPIAEKFGLKEGQYVFLMHTGSGLFGQYASYMYTPKKKEHLSQQIILKLGTTFFSSHLKNVYAKIAKEIEKYKNSNDFIGYKTDSAEGQMFFTAHKASANFGFANRTVLNHHLDQALEKTFGRQVKLEMLYDTTHISIEQENHYGSDVWVHRNGSVRANGPERMSEHPLFSQTGEPVFIPSSMSTPAYIAVGTNENQSSFFSAPHGTGRRAKISEETAKDKDQLFKKMDASHVKLYNAKSEGVIMQDSAYYKDIDEVISGMEENKMVNVVAKMQPVAVLMY